MYKRDSLVEKCVKTDHCEKFQLKLLSFPVSIASCERKWKDFSIIKTKKEID